MLGRRPEREVLDRLLSDVGAGASRALVVRGEAGIGKSTLLDYLLGQAADVRTVRADGREAEQELAFAALHQLCAPMLDRLDRLPAAQQNAMNTAFGLDAGSPPDRFVLGLAVLGLFAEAARDRSLLCVVDDAQWLDQASGQVLGFAARRLRAESVGIVFAVRTDSEHAEPPELAGLTGLRVTGLSEEDARSLLASAHPGPVDAPVLERIVAESQGNPLALLELPRGFTPAELAGGFGLLSAAALPRRIEESFRRQLAALPATATQVLLVAAAEPVGDPVLVWRAVERLGSCGAAADMQAAQADGLVEFGTHVRFRHPLLRSVIYNTGTAEQRRTAHAALAAVVDPVTDPDRRAWHLAQATAVPDEEVAAELDRRAGQAQARGGHAAAAAFLTRATELTPSAAMRGRRALAAAQAAYLAGTPDASASLLAQASAAPLGALERGQADLLRARLAFATNRGPQAAAMLFAVAGQLATLDPQLACDTYLEALQAGWFTAQLTIGPSRRAIAEAAAAARSTHRPAGSLLDGLVERYAHGYAAGAPLLKLALREFGREQGTPDAGSRALWFACTVALDLWDDDAADRLISDYLRAAQDSGTLTPLPMALTLRAVMHVFSGDLATAAGLLQEYDAVVDGSGLYESPYAEQLVAVWQGRAERALELIAATSAAAAERGEGVGMLAADWMRALLGNSQGRYEEALDAARQSVDPVQDMGVLTWSALVELITAAARTGQPDQATDALARLSEMADASGTDWALGLHARCQALVSDVDAAESHYRSAINRLGRTRIRGELARSHLHYGEWLRRNSRRNDARAQLRTAYDLFAAMGMREFAALAGRELAATGESVGRRGREPSARLTPQEAQIVRLVRDGLSNAEIGTRLFLSPRTVEWHLGKAFLKLGIRSRRQLRS